MSKMAKELLAKRGQPNPPSKGHPTRASSWPTAVEKDRTDEVRNNEGLTSEQYVRILSKKLSEQKTELESRTDAINSVQRNFESLSDMYSSERTAFQTTAMRLKEYEETVSRLRTEVKVNSIARKELEALEAEHARHKECASESQRMLQASLTAAENGNAKLRATVNELQKKVLGMQAADREKVEEAGELQGRLSVFQKGFEGSCALLGCESVRVGAEQSERAATAYFAAVRDAHEKAGRCAVMEEAARKTDTNIEHLQAALASEQQQSMLLNTYKAYVASVNSKLEACNKHFGGQPFIKDYGWRVEDDSLVAFFSSATELTVRVAECDDLCISLDRARADLAAERSKTADVAAKLASTQQEYEQLWREYTAARESEHEAEQQHRQQQVENETNSKNALEAARDEAAKWKSEASRKIEKLKQETDEEMSGIRKESERLLQQETDRLQRKIKEREREMEAREKAWKEKEFDFSTALAKEKEIEQAREREREAARVQAAKEASQKSKVHLELTQSLENLTALLRTARGDADMSRAQLKNAEDRHTQETTELNVKITDLQSLLQNAHNTGEAHHRDKEGVMSQLQTAKDETAELRQKLEGYAATRNEFERLQSSNKELEAEVGRLHKSLRETQHHLDEAKEQAEGAQVMSSKVARLSEELKRWQEDASGWEKKYTSLQQSTSAMQAKVKEAEEAREKATKYAADLSEKEQSVTETLNLLRSVQQETARTIKKLITSEDASESSYTCLSCLDTMKSPTLCNPCGHAFCFSCIHKSETCLECSEDVTAHIPLRTFDILVGRFLYRKQVLHDLEAALENASGRRQSIL